MQSSPEKPLPEEWTEVIAPKGAWFDLKLGELWRYRDLIMLFVYRDFVSVYKQTLLGPLWHIIQPLLTTLVFTVVFGNIAQLSTEGLPPVLFYMAGITIWNYFATCLIKTSNTFVSNAAIFGKVYFPRLAVPVSNVIAALFSFGVQFLLFLGFYAYFYLFLDFRPNLNIYVLLLPLYVLLMAVLSLGLGIIISALTTKYRDFTHLVAFGVQLLMYASPVIYPLSSISEKYRILFLLNPITPIIEGFKYSFLGEGLFSWPLLAYSCISTVLIFLLGVLLFNRIEKTFMDTV